MSDPAFSFIEDTDDGFAVVVNFALYAGRDPTQAEIDRLADALLEEIESLEIVSEQRLEIDRAGRASVHQVRVELAEASEPRRVELAARVEAWARDCIAERSVLTP